MRRSGRVKAQTTPTPALLQRPALRSCQSTGPSQVLLSPNSMQRSLIHVYSHLIRKETAQSNPEHKQFVWAILSQAASTSPVLCTKIHQLTLIEKPTPACRHAARLTKAESTARSTAINLPRCLSSPQTRTATLSQAIAVRQDPSRTERKTNTLAVAVEIDGEKLRLLPLADPEANNNTLVVALVMDAQLRHLLYAGMTKITLDVAVGISTRPTRGRWGTGGSLAAGLARSMVHIPPMVEEAPVKMKSSVWDTGCRQPG